MPTKSPRTCTRRGRYSTGRHPSVDPTARGSALAGLAKSPTVNDRLDLAVWVPVALVERTARRTRHTNRHRDQIPSPVMGSSRLYQIGEVDHAPDDAPVRRLRESAVSHCCNFLEHEVDWHAESLENLGQLIAISAAGGPKLAECVKNSYL